MQMRAPAGPHARLLIIDDEPPMVEAFCGVLSLHRHWELRSITDPCLATSVFAEFQPDLVLLDMSMPVMSGFEVLAALRAIISEDSYLPIVIVSADPRIETRREALDRGASDFVSKPFDTAEFLARIGNLLETRFAGLARIREAQRESDQRFAGAFKHSPIGMAMVSTDGRYLGVNRSLCQLFGYSEDELLTHGFQELTHPEDLPFDLEKLRQLLAREISGYQRQKRYVHARGHSIAASLSVSTVPDERGAPHYFISHVQDISERVRAEQALQISTALLEKALQANQQVLDHSLDVVCTIDATGRFTSLSAACEKLFGYLPAEMKGQHFLDFIHPADREAALEQLSALQAGRELHDYENLHLRKDGSVVNISWSATWSEAEQSIFCVGRDCTERKKVAEAQAAQQVAERANAAKSEFLSRMSHELRTPLNAILGFAQVLEGEDGLSGEQQESVRHILQGGSHLLELINEVLDISSIEAGNLPLSMEAVALPGLLEETARLLGPLSRKENVQIAVAAVADPGFGVWADRQRLRQVLLNLLGNAIKYNRPGGRVDITCQLIPASGSTGEMIRVSVADTGLGLSVEKLGRLFNPFDRLGAEQTPVEGTGLGLVLAKNMIEHMGGSLGVESIPGAGSKFWIELPAAPSPQGAESPEPAGVDSTMPLPTAAPRLLLYIEDNPANLRLVTRILTRRPAIKLCSAATRALGWQMACDLQPDLILLDLHLPDGLGSELLARLAADATTAAIPVVMLSADAVPQKRAELLDAGARAFITKPLNVGSFLEMLDRFLAPQRSVAGQADPSETAPVQASTGGIGV